MTELKIDLYQHAHWPPDLNINLIKNSALGLFKDEELVHKISARYADSERKN